MIESTRKEDVWPGEVLNIRYLSSADNTEQAMMFYGPENRTKVPLLIYLHPWSADYLRADGAYYAKWCVQHNWCLCIPNFRGPNICPDACGSELVSQDIISAVEYAKENCRIDSKRIYLIGVSGGGYASLLMAGRHPEIWAGLSAWVPIFDLKEWYYYCKENNLDYYRQMEKVCGGKPDSSNKANQQYKMRSASTWLPRVKNINVEICGGIHDEVIPVSQSIKSFNILAKPEDRIPIEDIYFIDENKKLPESMRCGNITKEKNFILFEKVSANARLVIFDGGHLIEPESALNFVRIQRKDENLKASV